MNAFSKLSHLLIKKISRKDNKRFFNQLNDIEKVQRRILAQMIHNLNGIHPKLSGDLSYEKFKSLPITSYNDWSEYILNQKNSDKPTLSKQVSHYQATSGSSSSIKWIPYNKEYKKQLDIAANVWMNDLYCKYPKLKNGYHYWSLSWVPNNMRDKLKTNDATLFEPFKQFLLANIFPVPDSVAHAQTIEQSMYQTVKHLVETPNLRLISIWSPTFFIELMQIILENKEKLLKEIKSKKQKNRLDKINRIEDLHFLWPKLTLISAWDTSHSKAYAKELQNLFPTTHFQGKGLWATEGVVTIPLKGKYYLAYQSHFYEFEIISSGKIIPSWELKVGDEVSPIITTPNGLLRYKINDRLVVDGFDGSCPLLTFLGRNDGLDMVGEKLSRKMATNLLSAYNGFCLVGVSNPEVQTRPYYALLCTDKSTIPVQTLDQELRQNYHYNLARDLNQLEMPRIIRVKDPLSLYQNLCRQKGMIKGNIKLESLIKIETDELLNEIGS